MNELQIFNSDLIPVYTTDTGEQVVIGRELHDKLEIKTPYDKWFPRMCEYGFEDQKDYSTFLSDRSDGKAGKPKTSHILKFDFAESGGKRCPDGSQQSRNLRKADRTASDKESRNGSTVMIPKFYEDWRQEADRQEILAQQEAERQHRRELLDDILLYVGIPLLVAAVLAAPTVCQVVFGG